MVCDAALCIFTCLILSLIAFVLCFAVVKELLK